MPRYKWESPLHWLLESKVPEYMEANAINEMQALVEVLAERLDSDTLQDLFQTEMDEDGYFQDLDEVEQDES